MNGTAAVFVRRLVYGVMSISALLQPNSYELNAGDLTVPNSLVLTRTKSFLAGAQTNVLRITGLGAQNPTAALQLLYTASITNPADTIAQCLIGIVSVVAVQTAAGVLTADKVTTPLVSIASDSQAIGVTGNVDVTVPGQVTVSLTVTSATLTAVTVGMQLQACNSTGCKIVFL